MGKVVLKDLSHLYDLPLQLLISRIGARNLRRESHKEAKCAY